MEELEIWNRDIFGNFFFRKKKCLARIEGVQWVVAKGADRKLEKLETKLIQEYNTILYQEELLWYQKTKVNWLQ